MLIMMVKRVKLVYDGIGDGDGTEIHNFCY